MVKKLLRNLKERFVTTKPAVLSKAELEAKVVKSAEQVVKEYPGIFERLAKYDRV